MKRSRSIYYLLTLLLLLSASDLHASAESDYDLGLKAYQAGDNVAAAAYFESALDQGMESLSLLYNLASSYYKVGRLEEAKEYFKQLEQTGAMRDIARYHLGLIAVKEKDVFLARQYFSSVVSSGEDKKLTGLSEKHLAALSGKEKRWRSLLSFNTGYDDNIFSASGDSVLDEADSFYELYASTDILLSGGRTDGWLMGAGLYGMKFNSNDENDQYNFLLGLQRATRFADWDSNIHLKLSKSTYAGDDFQTMTKLDVIARKSITRRERIYLRYRGDVIRSDNAIYDYLEGWRQRARIEYRNYAADNIKNVYYEFELNDRGTLVTAIDSYDYSPTRHTVRGVYTHIIDEHWWLTGDLAYRFSEFEASPTIDRVDDQWKLSLSADYRFDRTMKLTAKYQYTDNDSTVDRYIYDKSVFKIGMSKLF
ncbi:MAG: tetratricopeptide repeat protein [Gammaproteobacteria bacterium]|nr:tetratricopeptide repeat protein [Gammaproteobacteria bacterium]MBT8135354.1 tetratricopeptide repeat protein [Gammaproteobacteria bacterium]NNJ50648.1 tetratricopeptide repeat protein [Gammaproteobacteria bacterium]